LPWVETHGYEEHQTRKAGFLQPAGGFYPPASIAAMILTTEALVTDVPEKEKAPMMPLGGGGMDY